MQVSIEKTSGLERRLTVGVSAEEVDEKVTAKLQESARSVQLSGFRPGKVPFKVVRQRFGAGVRQEVVGEVVNRSFYEAISQEDVRPAGQPDIEEIKNEQGKDLEYVATFEVYPEIELVDLASISVAQPVVDISEEDTDKVIQSIRQQRASWEEVDRAAAEQDRVNIDYRGTRDGQEFEGGQAEGSDLVLGSGRMVHGFEDAITGMSAGEEKTVPLTFPEDYQAEDLKGAAVEFYIKVNSVNEQQFPELDDELFAQFGVKEGGEEAFRKEVLSNMERELGRAIKAKVKGRMFKALSDLHDIEVPKALVGSEIAGLRQQMVSQFGAGQQFDASIFPDELFFAEAERRVTLGLLVAEITRFAELEVDADKVRVQIEEMAATYDQPDQVVQYYYSNEQALNGVQSAVMEEQVVDYLTSCAQVSDEPASYEDALKPDEPDEPETPDEPKSDDD
ncbi:MAG: trigger factor [Gammaproteobacteria bacterium]|nr:MAG: trigger factor [Gammaproteobacteria bacterium]RLA53927.1 MAG: trigger factor [Gammaproteobacteria bacterium]